MSETNKKYVPCPYCKRKVRAKHKFSWHFCLIFPMIIYVIDILILFSYFDNFILIYAVNIILMLVWLIAIIHKGLKTAICPICNIYLIETPQIPSPTLTKLPSDQTIYEKQKYCPNCGEKILLNARFCSGCGVRVF